MRIQGLMTIGTWLMLEISKVIVEGWSRQNQGSINPAVTCIMSHSLQRLLLPSTLATIFAGIQKRSFVAARRKAPGSIIISSQSATVIDSVISLLSSSNGFKVWLGICLKNLNSFHNWRSILAQIVLSKICSKVCPSHGTTLSPQVVMSFLIVLSARIMYLSKIEKSKTIALLHFCFLFQDHF